MKTELITVISLAYNTSFRTIQSIESVRKQSAKIKHIIVDDCSTDNTPNLIQKWIEEHHYDCTFIKNESNLGINKSLNKALKLVQTKYVAPLGDDILLTNKLENDLSKFESLQDDYAVLFSNVNEVNEKNESISKLSYLEKNVSFYPNIPTGDIYQDILDVNFILAPTAVIKTEAIKNIGGYDENLYFEDWDMWLRLSQKGYKFHFDDRIDTNYVRVSSSIMGQGVSPKYAICIMETIYKHVNAFEGANDIILRKLKKFTEKIHIAKHPDTALWYKRILELEPNAKNKWCYRLAKLKFPYKMALPIANKLG